MKKPKESIKQKVRWVIMLTCSVVLACTATSFVAYEYISARGHLLDYVRAVAGLMGPNGALALNNRDQELGQRTLTPLAMEAYITRAALYDSTGRLFVFFPASSKVSDFPSHPGPPREKFTKGTFHSVTPLRQNEEIAGSLYLFSDMRPFKDRFNLYTAVVLTVLIGSIVVAFLTSSWLQRGITGPVISLAQTAKAVSDSHDFSLRAQKVTDDELGLLTESLNTMLMEIQARDSAIRRNNERLNLALESSRTGTWDYNIATGELQWDEFTHKLFGLRPGEFAGTYESFLNLIHPDERQLTDQMIQSAIQERRSLNVQYRIVWLDGSIHYMSSRGRAIFDSQGKAVRMVGVTIDVTESARAEQALRESEARFRTMADAAPIMVWTAGLQEERDYFNRAWLEFTGSSLAEQWGRGWMKVIHPDDLAKYQEELTEAFQRRSSFAIEYRLRRHDGDYRWILEHGVPRFDPDGTFEGYIGSCMDITELRLARADLEQRVLDRTVELAAANRELEAFAYSVSHDLRAPLRHIQAYTQILQEDFSKEIPPAALQHLNRIGKSTSNLGQLVDDLLNLARLGRQELKRAKCDLNIIVQEVREELEQEAKGREIQWIIHHLPIIECDPGLVRQIYANLLSNSVKYSRPRQVATILMTVDPQQPPIFSVQDNGVGFNMKYVNKLFGVFTRLHRAEEFEGTGVGLATVERIVRKHGGRIWAEAVEGEGAKFFFTLSPEQKEVKS
ncbi:MAG: PAS domain-containing protein [Verrucomicrobiota bacterium]|nr:PAS domain-containing protein [Verrucomicrobiota bacterium]